MRVYFIELDDDTGTSGYFQKEESTTMFKRMLERLSPGEKVAVVGPGGKVSITAKEISKQDFQALQKQSVA